MVYSLLVRSIPLCSSLTSSRTFSRETDGEKASNQDRIRRGSSAAKPSSRDSVLLRTLRANSHLESQIAFNINNSWNATIKYYNKFFICTNPTLLVIYFANEERQHKEVLWSAMSHTVQRQQTGWENNPRVHFLCWRPRFRCIQPIGLVVESNKPKPLTYSGCYRTPVTFQQRAEFYRLNFSCIAH